MASPTMRLFNTLLVTMVAILVGFFCVRLQLITPEEGHLKGIGFFIGVSKGTCTIAVAVRRRCVRRA